MTKVAFATRNLHLDSGEIVPGTVVCCPGEPLEVFIGKKPDAGVINLQDHLHIALGRIDTHVHFRESYIPTREEFDDDPFDGKGDYDEALRTIEAANATYDVHRGSLAALKGGVSIVLAMGNTPWGPKGLRRWEKTCELYSKKSWVGIHVAPRADPEALAILGQEDKDFASTFGGKGLTAEQRRKMYHLHSGGRMSYHNDQPRSNETIVEFARRVNCEPYMLHHLYFDGDTVLDSQRETIALAREAGLASLLTRHIPTGAALQMIIDERRKEGLELLAEIGLDYLYFNRDMLKDRPGTRIINYRRPALPSRKDQEELIDLVKFLARIRDPRIFIGSDHAPHPRRAKEFKNGLPGSPGTRIIEHSLQVQMHLIKDCGFSYSDIDWLTARSPAIYLSALKKFKYPIGKMETGAMANLVVFNPCSDYSADEEILREDLEDPEYHTAYANEKLFGNVLFTVTDGTVYNCTGKPCAINR